MNIFVFDIETVPDVDAGRKINEFENLEDKAVGDAMLQMQLQASGNEFLPHYLHKIVAISAVLRSRDHLSVWSLGEEDSDEPELIKRFYKGIDRFTPTLVSWNGSGFDLPVLHYRSLIHGVPGPSYWDNGSDNNAFKWNNYLNRYHERHTDLMDVLAAYQGRANAPLDKIAALCGFPGKMGMSGDRVWDMYCQGEVAAIRDYCETDVLNTYLVYLRYELIRGHLTQDNYDAECQLVKDTLEKEDKPHFSEFVALWNHSAQKSST